MITLLLTMPAAASIIILGTRIIYPASVKEVTVRLQNKGDSPELVQSWIDSGDPNQPLDEIKVPFILMPPVARIEPRSGQTLRLLFTGGNLSTDKESVFWLNVLAIPPDDEKLADKNKLQMAVRNRIKIFYRPAGLSRDGAELAAKQIVWRQTGNALSGYNNSPYHVNIPSVTVADAAGKKYSSVKGLMISPGGTQAFTLANAKNIQVRGAVNYTYIDDYGSARKVETMLSH